MEVKVASQITPKACLRLALFAVLVRAALLPACM